tara:strand:- start:2657 stop:2809 length:153 start_codon:yes stop_codon:yes gene_type:complete
MSQSDILGFATPFCLTHYEYDKVIAAAIKAMKPVSAQVMIECRARLGTQC